jgi:hypothetical protein
VAAGRASQRAHDSLRKQEIAEQAGEEQVLAEEAMEEWSGEHVPGDRVRDGCENPIELAQRRLPVILLPRNQVRKLGV